MGVPWQLPELLLRVRTMIPYDIARSCFEEIQRDFPDLRMNVTHDTGRREGSDVYLEVRFPVQPGLQFEVVLDLQNGDELQLCVSEHFCGYWFPCTDPAVCSRFSEAVKGLLSGRFRVRTYWSDTLWRGGLYRKGVLERPASDGWEVVYTHHSGPSFLGYRQEVLQNRDLDPVRKP